MNNNSIRKNVLVSIIVPVYNAEKYIGRCLESICRQTHSNIEAILVDDGSSDLSYQVCSRYAEQDDRIKLFQQNNKGPASARNLGISQVKGEFIYFVDADDYIEEKCVEKLLDALSDSDIAIMSKKYDGSPNPKVEKLSKEQTYYMYFKIYPYDQHACEGYLWNKLFRTEIIKQHDILFENYRMWEDMLFCCSYTQFISTASYIQGGYYYYTDNRNDSISHSLNLEGLKSWTNAAFRIADILKRESDILLRKYYKVSVNICMQYYIFCCREKNLNKHFAEDEWWNFIKNNYDGLRRKYKIYFHLALISRRIFEISAACFGI